MEWRDLKVWVQGIHSKTGYTEDYSGIYLVSNEGEIKTINGEIVTQKKSSRMPPYRSVILTDKNGKEHERLVHRIVATTFKDICGEINQVVNHLDENKFNNSAFNLSWCTLKENFEYGHARELSKTNLKKSIQAKKERERMEEEMKKIRPVLINY